MANLEVLRGGAKVVVTTRGGAKMKVIGEGAKVMVRRVWDKGGSHPGRGEYGDIGGGTKMVVFSEGGESGGHQGRRRQGRSQGARGDAPLISFKSSTGKDYFGLKLCEIYIIFQKNFCLRRTLFSFLVSFYQFCNVFL